LGDLGEDRRGGVDQHPAVLDVAEGRVRAADGRVREVVQLGERLDAGVASAYEDEAEVALRLLPVEPGGGRLERSEQVIPQGDRVDDVLEAAAVLGEPRDRERPGLLPAPRRGARRRSRMSRRRLPG
jgi:hypothetical protein